MRFAHGIIGRVSEFTVTGLRLLQEVAAQGSFSAAAAGLGYSQSAVSRQVALLEATAGAPLFERLPRGVRPTPAGIALLRHAGPVLERLDAAALELRTMQEGLGGRLRLGAFPTALAGLVPGALARLAEQAPGIEVRLREGGSVAQLRRLRAGRLDLAVIATGGGLTYDLDGLLADQLLAGRPSLAVGLGHRFAERGWAAVGELAEERWIVGEPDAGGPQFGVWPTLEGPHRIAHAVRDWPARFGLVAAGLGVAVVPSLLANTVPAGVRIVAVDDPRPVVRTVLAVTAPDRSPAVQAVVGALHEAAGDLRRPRARGRAGSPG
jgi:DNA-binding transcriptional LysR family regulator